MSKLRTCLRSTTMAFSKKGKERGFPVSMISVSLLSASCMNSSAAPSDIRLLDRFNLNLQKEEKKKKEK